MLTCRENRFAAARRRTKREGFTLVEVLVAVAIVGIAVSALMVTIQSVTRANGAGQELTQAVYLAQAVRERVVLLPFRDPDPGDADNPPGPDGSDPQFFVDDLDDLMDVTYSPPRNAAGAALLGMNDWAQQIVLEWKDPESLTTTVAPGNSDIIRVTVTIRRDGRAVLATGWLVARRKPV